MRGSEGKTPKRMCLGCRTRVEQRDLLRIGVGSTSLVLGAKGGRGLYVHPEPECWSKVVGQEKLVAKALRLTGENVWLKGALKELNESSLNAAYRKGSKR